MPAYQENDIMAAIEYLEETARKLGRPLILCLGLGTNNGSHSGGSNLSELLDDIAGRWRRCAVVATGNEANARHHFSRKNDVWHSPHFRLPDIIFTGKVMEIQWLR